MHRPKNHYPKYQSLLGSRLSRKTIFSESPRSGIFSAFDYAQRKNDTWVFKIKTTEDKTQESIVSDSHRFIKSNNEIQTQEM